MKKIAFLLLLWSAAPAVFSQNCLTYYFDQYNQFYIYDNGNTIQAEPIAPKNIKVGRNTLAYTTNLGRMKLYFNGKTYPIAEIECPYYMTDNWFVYRNFGLLGVLYNNELKILDKLATDSMFFVSDSLITWSTAINDQKIFYKGEVIQLERWPVNSAKISDNILAYTTNEQNFKVFYQGEKTVLEGYEPANYIVNRDIVVYEDYYGTYKVFYKGKTYQTSTIVQKNNYWVGEDFFAYYNQQGQLNVWYEGEETTICQDQTKTLTINENMIVFGDKANNFWCWYKGNLKLIERYIPTDYKVDNDILVYRDLYGTLYGYYFGEKVKISDQIPKSYILSNYTVAYTVAEGETRIWCKNKIVSVR